MNSLLQTLFVALSVLASGFPTQAQVRTPLCGGGFIRGPLNQTMPFRQLSGATTYVCEDGTLLAIPDTDFPTNSWWRIATSDSTWQNPLVTACLVPLAFTSNAPEPWFNVLGILAPYRTGELNYATSFRYDGRLVIKKEVVDYRDLSSYHRVTARVLLGVPIGMAVSRVTTGYGHSLLRSWIRIGDCNVDTNITPQVRGYDDQGPRITQGSVVLRTDFLIHRVLTWSICESDTTGVACIAHPQQFVPALLSSPR